MWTKRGKARLILIFSTNTNCENMAYRSFRSEKCSARGVRKVTTGIIRKTVTSIRRWMFTNIQAGENPRQPTLNFSITGISGLWHPRVHSVFFTKGTTTACGCGFQLLARFPIDVIEHTFQEKQNPSTMRLKPQPKLKWHWLFQQF